MKDIKYIHMKEDTYYEDGSNESFIIAVDKSAYEQLLHDIKDIKTQEELA